MKRRSSSLVFFFGWGALVCFCLGFLRDVVSDFCVPKSKSGFDSTFLSTGLPLSSTWTPKSATCVDVSASLVTSLGSLTCCCIGFFLDYSFSWAFGFGDSASLTCIYDLFVILYAFMIDYKHKMCRLKGDFSKPISSRLALARSERTWTSNSCKYLSCS